MKHKKLEINYLNFVEQLYFFLETFVNCNRTLIARLPSKQKQNQPYRNILDDVEHKNIQ